MISENDRYAKKFRSLQKQINDNTKPLVITEGKTDWMHLKAAMKALKITDLDFDFYVENDTLGDKALLRILKDYARIKQTRRIIGVFDRDDFSELKNNELETQEYISFQNNVYAFAIPLVNAEEYGNDISIEHYYKKADLTKEDTHGRRLFLGSEFHESGFSKDGKYHTKTGKIDSKVKKNGVIDEKVYDISTDLEEKHSIALSKSEFADLVLQQDDFSVGFDYSEFTNIFNVLRNIMAIDNI